MGSGWLLRLVAHNFVFLAGYASVEALETKSLVDDQQWLTYWVLYSLMTLFELTFAKLIECKQGDVLIDADTFTVGNEPEALEKPISKIFEFVRSAKVGAQTRNPSLQALGVIAVLQMKQ